MFIASKEEIVLEINKINTYLKECLWMDFTISNSNWGEVNLYGTIDQTHNNYIDNYDIKITFEYPYFISTLLSFTSDNSKKFVHLCTEKEQDKIIEKYKVEAENFIFKINIEDFEVSPIIIAAKNIKCEIINENPFSNNKQ